MKSARLIHTGYGVWVARPRRKRAAAQAARRARDKMDMEVFAQIARNSAAIDGIPPFLGRALFYMLMSAIVFGFGLGLLG